MAGLLGPPEIHNSALKTLETENENAPSTNYSLLGPPEIYNSTLQTQETETETENENENENGNEDAPSTNNLSGPPEIQSESKNAPSTTGDPFVDLMVANFNKTNADPKPPMGLTENCSATFLSTANPCLDFFFHVVPDTLPASLLHWLHLAWSHHSLTTFKLICNLRGVRGTGKSDREGFYASALWLHQHHPQTLASNVPSFAHFGYFKDLPEILYRILEGLEVRKILKQQRKEVKNNTNRKKKKKNNKRIRTQSWEEDNDQAKNREMNATAQAKKEEEKASASAARQEKKIAMAKKVLEKYRDDSDFRNLYDSVSDHFAQCLKADFEFLKSKELNKISLAAKWCPSIDSSFDRSTLLCESIARRIFPRESCPEYEGIEEAHYAYRIRDRLRREILVPLRRVLELPEIYTGANKWDSIPYNRVASVAMKFYKEKFMKHDKERFTKYLEDVKSGKSTIAAGALLPHEITMSLRDRDTAEVAKLQWKRMVDDMVKEGKLKNCLAVCDVSGSMEGIPMEVSVALGLLVSELSEEPWKGKVITFSKEPQLHVIEGDGLVSKTEFLRNMDWGMNTDFQKVFDKILEVAVDGNVKEEQMIKRVFVFSDMEFDRASLNPWETDYEAIRRKFGEKGYGSVVPQIVFWNLRDSRATPVPGNQKGVALLSGFSKNLLRLFTEKCGDIDPLSVMEAAISGQEYQKLVVLD